MSNYTATEPGRSLGTIIKELTADFSTLFRSEVALVKLEIKDMFAKLGTGGAMLAAAVFLAIFGMAFLFVTVTLALVALGVPAWVSSLIVTIVLFGGAAVLAVLGKKKIAAVQFVPSDSVEHIRNDIESIRSNIERVRSR